MKVKLTYGLILISVGNNDISTLSKIHEVPDTSLLGIKGTFLA